MNAIGVMLLALLFIQTPKASLEGVVIGRQPVAGAYFVTATVGNTASTVTGTGSVAVAVSDKPKPRARAFASGSPPRSRSTSLQGRGDL